MAKKRRPHDEEAWRNAKTICRLTAQWLAHGKVTEVLPEVSEELRDIAKALDSGAPISAIPEIPVPPRSTRAPSSRGRAHERPWDDEDDIPF